MESCKEEKNDSGKPLVDSGASSNSESTARSTGSKDGEESSNSLECPICLQNCIHPVELPCSHIFCFLCIKGVAAQGPHSRCAICRQDIPHNVLTNPRLKDISQLYKDPTLSSGFHWFYESRSDGWWLYDERTMQELEKAFESKQSTFQIMIAGYMYEIDFDQMIQYRVNNPTMSRRIKRDLPTTEKRGIAGIRLNTKRGDGTNNHSNGAAGIRRGASTASARNRSSPSNNLSESQRTLSMPHLTSQVDGPPVFEVDTDSDVEEDGQEADDDCASLDDEDVDDDEDDMELGEEEDDDDEDNDDEETGLRDGARAPTSRSDRSNSSNNQTTPPSTPSQCNGQSGGRGNHARAGHSRNISSTNTSGSASSGNSRNNSAEPIIINVENNSSETSVQRLEEHVHRTSPPASFEIDSNVSNCNVLNAPQTLSDNNQYIIIGPSLQIRLQYNNDVPMPVDEIL